jgi:putative transposase
MPRQARLRIPGWPLHVIQRGNNRQDCFGEERDFRVYLLLLDELSSLHGCDVHAYVLMTNHVHLLLTPRGPYGASPLMKALGQRFVQYVNRKHARSGRLFEGRFRSCIVDSDEYLLRCHRYIEMNPVRAGMVAHPSRYKWSSYLANGEGRPCDFLVPHALYIGLASEAEERRRLYRALFELPEPPSELREIRQAVNSGKALAGESFLANLDEKTRAKATLRCRGRPRIALPTERSA